MKFFRSGIELDVPENAYYPEEDSLLLAEEARKAAKPGMGCLDMGCGSGIIAIMMAKKGAIVTATDVSKDSIAATRKNAIANDVAITAVESDLFAAVRDKYDLIAFNPPYLPEGEGDEYLTDMRS
ncbi:MAG: methyltransferase, partial [Candidatus Aenigmarchaeota archaeon]|nr:methyltransferase [Candidatus Aenigmarchaeota archaeon]